MEIEFVGAARCVTGSKHIIRTARTTLLLDCGLVQGKRRESISLNRSLGLDARAIDAVVLSHAHIDHSGALPLLVKNGFDGSVYATPATRDLCAAMLADAASIQYSDARYINKLIERDHVDMDHVDPLYEDRDVVKVLERMVSIPYHRRQIIAPGVYVTFYDAGHVLGSAVTAIDVEEDGVHKRVVFTGDLGRQHMPILKDPEVAPDASVLITESTYGDRLHEPIEAMEEQLLAVIQRTYQRGGKVIVPSFSLERAQEVIFVLRKLERRGLLPKMPCYVDSPLTVKITDIFKLHPECYDEETRGLVSGKESPFEFRELGYVTEQEDSKALSASNEPAIIISASGMCEGGRVVHHLKSTIESEKNTVMLVGYQAQHTLGRRIQERRKRVRIFGVERDLRAEVAVLSGFSAHADQRDLLHYADLTRAQGNLRDIVLVHGEEVAMNELRERLLGAGHTRVHAPGRGDRITV
jgi:metallo-beta-lactamase family protein